MKKMKMMMNKKGSYNNNRRERKINHDENKYQKYKRLEKINQQQKQKNEEKQLSSIVINNQYLSTTKTAMQNACQTGNVVVVSRLLVELLQYLHKDHETGEEDIIQFLVYCLHRAVHHGQTAVVEVLLKSKRVDPRITPEHYFYRNDDSLIPVAIYNNKPKIVKLLLEDGRIGNNDHLLSLELILASKEGRSEIVDILLGDKRVDASYNNNDAIRMAINGGHAKVVESLLRDKKSSDSLFKRINEKEEEMVESGNFAVLFKSPYSFDNLIMKCSLEIFSLLLRDDRLNFYLLLNITCLTIELHRSRNGDKINRLMFHPVFKMVKKSSPSYHYYFGHTSRLKRLVYKHSSTLLAAIMCLLSPSFIEKSGLPVDIIISILQYEIAFSAKELNRIYKLSFEKKQPTTSRKTKKEEETKKKKKENEQ